MPRTNEALDIMNKISSSPYKPEPPKKSFAVSLFMKLGQFTKRGGYVTPHLSGGSNLSKVEWEYNAGNTFFERISEYVTMDILDNKDVLDVGCGWGGKMIYFAEHSNLKTINGFDMPNVYVPEVST